MKSCRLRILRPPHTWPTPATAPSALKNYIDWMSENTGVWQKVNRYVLERVFYKVTINRNAIEEQMHEKL